MKDKILFIIIFSFIFLTLAKAEEICIDCIIEIESGVNPNAYNAKSKAIGLMQITPKVLEEYNIYRHLQPSSDMLYKILGDGTFERYTYYQPQELIVEKLNKEIGTWYIKTQLTEYLIHYKIPLTIENYLIAYNWGIGNLVKWYKSGAKWNKLPKETKKYIFLYRKYEKSK